MIELIQQKSSGDCRVSCDLAQKKRKGEPDSGQVMKNIDMFSRGSIGFKVQLIGVSGCFGSLCS